MASMNILKSGEVIAIRCKPDLNQKRVYDKKGTLSWGQWGGVGRQRIPPSIAKRTEKGSRSHYLGNNENPLLSKKRTSFK